jgi:hypothetical protein
VIIDPQPVPVDDGGWVDIKKCCEIAVVKRDKFAIQFYNKVILESAPLLEDNQIFQEALTQDDINKIIDNTHKDVLNSGFVDNKK